MSAYKGNPAEAARSIAVARQRAHQQEEMKFKIEQAERENQRASTDISMKFAAKSDDVEEKLKINTYGLLTFEQMKAHHEAIEAERIRLAKALEPIPIQQEEKKKKKASQSGVLSFSMNEDDEDEDEDDGGRRAQAKPSRKQSEDIPEQDQEDQAVAKRKRFGKNPEVDTSFLPDRDREEEERKERERLMEEIRQKREATKSETIDVAFAYWDGTSHRQIIKMRKGNTIGEFLTAVLLELREEFSELRGVSAESLMFIKEDLIIPHHYSFFDFIIARARGKSGPLFAFDVSDEVRFSNDAKVERNEAHAGKVLLRSWYERNKHIFPASRWEPYDPEKKWEKYTMKDKPAK